MMHIQIIKPPSTGLRAALRGTTGRGDQGRGGARQDVIAFCSKV